jgi:hypothetical protein
MDIKTRLKAKAKAPKSKLISLWLPPDVAEQVAQLERSTGATRTDVILELLREALKKVKW